MPSNAYTLFPSHGFNRHHWYIVAWPEELTANEPLARTILGDDLVLFRTPEGQAVAMEDRCGHRLAPLSLGTIEAGGIRCMYHGVKFDTAGRCTEVPAQAANHPTMCVKSYPLVERDGFVWVWMGPADEADASTILPAPWHHDPNWVPSRGYQFWNAHVSLMADNLLDFGHLPFVHRNTLGSARQADVLTEFTPMAHGVRANRWYLNVAASPFHQSIGNFSGNVDAWHCADYHHPAIMSMDSGSAPTGTGARDKPHGTREGAIEFHHIAALTPQDDDHTHYFWVHWRNFALNDDQMTETIHQNISSAFTEDQAMVEAQHKAIRRGSQTRPMAIEADKGLTMLRSQLAKASRVS
jgi:vanillate O-demethylase monooxygenase subunit